MTSLQVDEDDYLINNKELSSRVSRTRYFALGMTVCAVLLVLVLALVAGVLLVNKYAVSHQYATTEDLNSIQTQLNTALAALNQTQAELTLLYGIVGETVNQQNITSEDVENLQVEMKNTKLSLLDTQLELQQVQVSVDAYIASNDICTESCYNGGVMQANCTCTGCASGFTGTYCQTAVYQNCSLVCQNGGLPNSNCTECVDCQVGYSGTYCNVWTSPSNSSEVYEQIDQILQINGSNTTSPYFIRSTERELMDEGSLPTRSELVLNFLGYGTGKRSGEYLEPILDFTYSSNIVFTPSGEQECAPDQARVIALSKPLIGSSESQTYCSMEQLSQAYDKAEREGQATVFNSGLQSSEWLNIAENIFGAGQIISSTRMVYNLYEVSVNRDRITIAPDVQQLINYLPDLDPDDESTVAAWLYSLEVLGRTVVTGGTWGAYVESTVSTAACSLNYLSSDAIATGAQSQLNQALHFPITPSSEEFQYASVSSISELVSFGGNPSLVSTNTTQYVESIASDMVPTRLEVTGICEFFGTKNTSCNLAQSLVERQEMTARVELMTSITETVANTWSQPLSGTALLRWTFSFLYIESIQGDFPSYSMNPPPQPYTISVGQVISFLFPASALGIWEFPAPSCLFTLSCTRDSNTGLVTASLSTLAGPCLFAGGIQVSPPIVGPYLGNPASNGECSIVTTPEFLTAQDASVMSAEFACCNCEDAEYNIVTGNIGCGCGSFPGVSTHISN